jgi:2-iminobutanoate/2-iminopropanoate deaminase
MIKKVTTLNAPSAIGAYSQAVISNGFVFCSGQIGINPKTETLVGPGIVEEAQQAIKNLLEVIKASGSSTKKIVKVEILLTDINDFRVVNDLYAILIKNRIMPARQTSQVAKLPKGARIEISCIGSIK